MWLLMKVNMLIASRAELVISLAMLMFVLPKLRTMKCLHRLLFMAFMNDILRLSPVNVMVAPVEAFFFRTLTRGHLIRACLLPRKCGQGITILIPVLLMIMIPGTPGCSDKSSDSGWASVLTCTGVTTAATG